MPHILAVEDVSEIVDLYRIALPNYTFASTASVDSALDYLRKNEPDLVLLDLILVDGSGLSVLRYMRHTKRLKTVPVVCVTSDDEQRGAALSQGANAFFVKPFDLLRLKATVEALAMPPTKEGVRLLPALV